jgi:deoxyribodipyrimidine photolyase-like uncharacterized protein
MAEVAAESEHVWSAQPRTALFLAAMRHFRDARRAAGWTVFYTELDDPANTQTLAGELGRAIADAAAATVGDDGGGRLAGAAGGGGGRGRRRG